MACDLFCIPYAGGSATVYHRWKQALAPSITVRPLELRGRGSRFAEGLYADYDQAVQDLTDGLQAQRTAAPYALFGHSMGADLAYRVVLELRDRGVGEPVHLFLSGRRAPAFRAKDRPLHALPEPQLLAELRALGGTSEDFFASPELRQIFLPVIRSDYAMLAARRDAEHAPLLCPVTVLSGKQDEFSQAELEGWVQHTRGAYALKYFDGGHFYLLDAPERITDFVGAALRHES